MITDIKDIKGNEFHIGDYVAWGDTTSTHNAIICYGEIINIEIKKSQTHIKVKIIKEGGYWPHIGQTRIFIYPRNYHNLIKL